MKPCKTCGVEKPLDDYHRNPVAKDGRQSNCRPCCKKYAKRYQVENSDSLKKKKSEAWANLPVKERTARARNAKYLNRYGLTTEDYENILESQNGVCAICHGGPIGKKTRLCVDHSHITGVVRGLLCDNCNVGLGRFEDSVELLQSALSYISE